MDIYNQLVMVKDHHLRGRLFEKFIAICLFNIDGLNVEVKPDKDVFVQNYSCNSALGKILDVAVCECKFQEENIAVDHVRSLHSKMKKFKMITPKVMGIMFSNSDLQDEAEKLRYTHSIIFIKNSELIKKFKTGGTIEDLLLKRFQEL